MNASADGEQFLNGLRRQWAISIWGQGERIVDVASHPKQLGPCAPPEIYDLQKRSSKRVRRVRLGHFRTWR